MRNLRIMLVGGLMAAALVGCRNRVAEERDALWQQTREQQAAMDRQNAELEAQRRAAQAVPAPPPPPPVTAPAPQPPAPPPVRVAAPDPRSLEEIEGTELSRDPGAGTVTLNLSSDIFFDAGAATIKPAARKSLDKVAAALKKDYSGKDVRVEGHTDSDPIKRSKWKSNQELSEARAKAVRDYLVKQGVDASGITTLGHGADRPRGADKARNRRVEVVVLVDANAPNARPARAAAAPEEPELNK
jgi:outer membrane protein OmpA-like peptidoglycan-associated protein